MKKLLISLTLLGATSLNADVEAGEKVYKNNCAICHTINGGGHGGGLGPDFNMVAYTRHKEEIEYYAKDPDSMYKAFGYSSNAMPTLPLEDQEFKDVSEYISSLQPFKKWMIKKKPVKKKMEDKKESLENNISEESNISNESNISKKNNERNQTFGQGSAVVPTM